MNMNQFTRELNKLTPCKDQETLDRMEYLIGTLLESVQEKFQPRHVARLRKVLRYSAHVHKNEYREDRMTPYFLHPLEVAVLLIEEGLVDFEMLCAAILHDAVETMMKTVEQEATKEAKLEKLQETLEDLSKHFGAMIKDIVDALTKRPGEGKDGNTDGYYVRQLTISRPDNRPTMWQLAVACRMIPVKFQDRTHNVKTLGCMPEHKRQLKIAETLEWFPKLRQSLIYVIEEMEKRDMEPRFPEDLPDRLYQKLEKEINQHQKYVPFS